MELNLISKINTAFKWLIPHRCVGCKTVIEHGSYPFCDSCYIELPFQDHCCRRCGQAFTSELDYCGRCLVSPPAFDACFCPFKYEEPISGQIQKFKYSYKSELANGLAQSIYREILSNNIKLPELLVPVPIHIGRLRERGFNQSLLLAKNLSTLLNVPYSNNIIKKHRATLAQVELSLKNRQKNVRKSFKLSSKITAKSVAIVDDVFTTGATVAEITKILKRNGVDYVQIWGVAHTN